MVRVSAARSAAETRLIRKVQDVSSLIAITLIDSLQKFKIHDKNKANYVTDYAYEFLCSSW